MLLTLVVLLLQFPVILVPWDAAVFGRALIFLADIPLALLAVLMAPTVVREARAGRVGSTAASWAVACAALAVAWVVHPSLAGGLIVLRAVAAVAVAHAVATTTRPDERRFIVTALALTAVVQAAIGTLQVVRGGPIGLTELGELSDPLHERNASLSPRGTMVYVYLLTALALLAAARAADTAVAAARPLPWLAAAALAVWPVGLSYSRAAAVALAIGVAALARDALRGRRVHALAIGALLVGAVVPAAIWNDGWLGRVRQTLDVGTPARPQDRQILLLEGLKIVVASPLVGVGPGRYLDAARERAPDGEVLPVHSMPVLVAAEAGVIAGAAVVVMLIVGAWRALRSGATAMLTYSALAPFVVLDQFLYTTGQGLVLLGLWMGYVDPITRPAASASTER